MQEGNAEERASAQASSQVAPSLSIPPTAGRNSHDGPQPQPHLDTAPHSNSNGLLTSSAVSSEAKVDTSGSILSSPVVDTDSPMETQPQIEPQTREDAPPTKDLNMNLQQPEDVHMESQTAEMPVAHITPATPPSTQEQDSKTRTPSPEILPQAENTTPEDIAPGDKIALPSPATTAPVSDRAPSPFERLLEINGNAKRDHYRRAQIFTKTRVTMRWKSNNMFFVASRGFERGLLPTKRTTPPLLKRRYSIDANVKDWGKLWPKGWNLEDELEFERKIPTAHHLNPPPFLGMVAYPPNPSRYTTFGRVFAPKPPFNEEIYLELGDARISNAAFRYIDVIDWSYQHEVWMRDESIGMALEVLRRDLHCDAHGIGIANSNIAQVCYLAALFKDGSTREFDEYRERFQSKKWIFVVINDAIGSDTNEGTKGTHWSLVALDRQGKKAHYYDSLLIDYESYRDKAEEIASGMLLILGDDARLWHFAPEWRSPHQNWHNQFSRDSGACGPFLFKMTEVQIRKIQHYQRMGMEQHCSLELGDDFPWYFKSRFHSLHVRLYIQERIAHWKAMLEAQRLVHDHDQQAILGTGVTLVDEPVADITLPPRRLLPIQQESSHNMNTNRRHSRSSHRSTSNPRVDIELSDDENVTVIRSSSRTSQVQDNADPFEEDGMNTSMSSDEGELDSDMGDDDDDETRQTGGISLVGVENDDDGDDANVVEIPQDPEDDDEHAAVRRIA